MRRYVVATVAYVRDALGRGEITLAVVMTGLDLSPAAILPGRAPGVTNVQLVAAPGPYHYFVLICLRLCDIHRTAPCFTPYIFQILLLLGCLEGFTKEPDVRP